MNKIKIRLEVWKNVVIMQILEMDERFRNERLKSYAPEFESSNGYLVRSSSQSSLGKNYIYLRGIDKGYDYDISSKIFNTEKEAESYKKDIICALKDWSENWPGFKENSIMPTSDSNIYTF